MPGADIRDISGSRLLRRCRSAHTWGISGPGAEGAGAGPDWVVPGRGWKTVGHE